MPLSDAPVARPAGYVTEQLVAFGTGDGRARMVDGSNPLPVQARLAGAQAASLSGTASTSTVAGPFVPDLGRTIWVTLAGSWAGTAQLLRSIDGGTTRLPITIAGQPWASWTVNANEAVGEETVAGATYYLALTISSGTIAYRVQQ